MGPVLSDSQRPFLGDVHKKAQAIQKQNTAPHVLSHGGYEYLEQKLLAEKTKKKLEEATQSGSVDGVIDPPSSVRRRVKWKMARKKKTGEMTTEAAKEIAEKIDVLTAAIRRPEHPGRVRATGVNVTIKQYFGSTPRTSRSSSFLPLEELQQLTQQIRDQLEESITEKVTRQLMATFSQMQSQIQSQMQSQGLALPTEPLVGPSSPRVSTKGSCVDPSGNDPETGDSDSGVGNSHLPCLADTSGLVFITAAMSPAKPPQKPNLEVDDPLYLMTLTIPELFLRPYQVTWDATVFGVFNPDFSLYIKHEDLFEIAHGGQCLCISVLQLWILMRTRNSDIYGFLEPQSIQRSGQSQFESKSYIKTWMQSSKWDVYLGAYLNGGHWQMVVIVPKEHLVVWFCSLHNRPDNYLKGIINMLVFFSIHLNSNTSTTPLFNCYSHGTII
ncbi:hypothetical protein HKD37_20G056313 [Glycine soja]